MAGIADYERRTIMAFVNEKLTPEQRQEFVKRKISLPESIVSIPTHRTFDKERNMCLYQLCVFGRDNWDDIYFLFDWSGEEHIVLMKYTNPSKGNIIWYISSIESSFSGKEVFAQDLQDALIVYAVNGFPDQAGLESVQVKMKKEEK